MSRIPPLPEPFYGDCDVVRGEAYSADQLRARDRQIVEACAVTAWRVGMEVDASRLGMPERPREIGAHIAAALRSLLGEGEGNTNGG